MTPSEKAMNHKRTERGVERVEHLPLFGIPHPLCFPDVEGRHGPLFRCPSPHRPHSHTRPVGGFFFRAVVEVPREEDPPLPCGHRAAPKTGRRPLYGGHTNSVTPSTLSTARRWWKMLLWGVSQRDFHDMKKKEACWGLLPLLVCLSADPSIRLPSWVAERVNTGW